MRHLVIAAAILTAASTPALAEQPTTAPLNPSSSRVYVCDRSPDHGEGWLRECASLSASTRANLDARAPVRQVFICDSVDTQASWRREFGAVKFVTAAELSRAAALNQAWSAPRCMTSAEARRYAKGRPERASLVRSIAMAD